MRVEKHKKSVATENIFSNNALLQVIKNLN